MDIRRSTKSPKCEASLFRSRSSVINAIERVYVGSSMEIIRASYEPSPRISGIIEVPSTLFGLLFVYPANRYRVYIPVGYRAATIEPCRCKLRVGGFGIVQSHLNNRQLTSDTRSLSKCNDRGERHGYINLSVIPLILIADSYFESSDALYVPTAERMDHRVPFLRD